MTASFPAPKVPPADEGPPPFSAQRMVLSGLFSPFTAFCGVLAGALAGLVMDAVLFGGPSVFTTLVAGGGGVVGAGLGVWLVGGAMEGRGTLQGALLGTLSGAAVGLVSLLATSAMISSLPRNGLTSSLPTAFITFGVAMPFLGAVFGYEISHVMNTKGNPLAPVQIAPMAIAPSPGAPRRTGVTPGLAVTLAL